MSNKITLDTLEDLKNNQEKIKDENIAIGKFQGKIIENIRKTMRDKISEFIEIKYLLIKRPLKNNRDYIFIKGDFDKEKGWNSNKIQLIKVENKYAYTIINITNRDFEKNAKIEFKFICKNRTNQDKNKIDKFQWENGGNRYIMLDKIKETLINSYKENFNNDKNVFKNFQVKVNNKQFFEDSFSYDLSHKTLIIECKDRDYQNEYLDEIQ